MQKLSLDLQQYLCTFIYVKKTNKVIAIAMLWELFRIAPNFKQFKRLPSLSEIVDRYEEVVMLFKYVYFNRGGKNKNFDDLFSDIATRGHLEIFKFLLSQKIECSNITGNMLINWLFVDKYNVENKEKMMKLILINCKVQVSSLLNLYFIYKTDFGVEKGRIHIIREHIISHYYVNGILSKEEYARLTNPELINKLNFVVEINEVFYRYVLKHIARYSRTMTEEWLRKLYIHTNKVNFIELVENKIKGK